jgi:hypothetical protein
VPVENKGNITHRKECFYECCILFLIKISVIIMDRRTIKYRQPKIHYAVIRDASLPLLTSPPCQPIIFNTPQYNSSLSLCLFVSLSVSVSVSQYLCTSASLSLCLFFFSLSVLPVCLSICISVSLYLCLLVSLPLFSLSVSLSLC